MWNIKWDKKKPSYQCPPPPSKPVFKIIRALVDDIENFDNLGERTLTQRKFENLHEYIGKILKNIENKQPSNDKTYLYGVLK